MPKGVAKTPLILAIFFIAFLAFSSTSRASVIDELRQEIKKRNEEIKKLEEEANQFREEIAEHQERGKTLSAEIKRLDRNISQIRRDIALTERKIERLELEIEVLILEIRSKELSIQKFKSGLASLIEALFEKERESPLASLIKYPALSEFFKQIDYFAMFKEKVIETVSDLKDFKKELEIKKSEVEDKKKEEEDLRTALRGRNAALVEARKERTYILAETKNQEKKYRQLLDEREKKIAALSEEIREIEEKIRITIDPSLLPPKGSGVLGWPLSKIFLISCGENSGKTENCITQFFGYTQFAATGGYNGKGHNGVDFRASFGTPVFSAEKGTVQAVGDTDIGCRGASYGKWILIRHNNGLSTLYAHLSGINVSAGQEVSRGERIGFSGSSGYATGPHLHFTVFASQAVEITSLRSRVCGRLMVLPLAPINGYLNPLDYL